MQETFTLRARLRQIFSREFFPFFPFSEWELLAGADKFPKVWTIPYNLACYCCKLGRVDECQDWLKKAMAIDKLAVQRAALDDPDLKPLWDSMSGTLWKRTD